MNKFANLIPIDTARVMQVIVTTLTRRGQGKPDSPIRVVTQYWSVDGKLLAENDPDISNVPPQQLP